MPSVKKQSSKTMVSTPEDVLEYLNSRFAKEVILWNKKCGRDINEIDDVSILMKQMLQQAKVVLEECVEGLSAYLKGDSIEQLDALVDILVTKVMLEAYSQRAEDLSKEMGEVEYQEALTQAVDVYDPNDLLVIEIVNQITEPSLLASEGINKFSPQRIYIACELILENNNQKVTNDLSVKEEWEEHLNGECGIKTCNIKGENWYSIYNIKSGKTQKPYNFVSVVL